MAPLLISLSWVVVPVVSVVVYAYIRGSRKIRRYLVVRSAMVVPLVLLMGTVVFIIMRIVPGDPVATESSNFSTPEQQDRIRDELGLNDSLIVQYGRFLKGVVTLDFGTSVTGGRRNVAEELSERLPATAELVIPAAIVAVIFGVLFGMIAALRRGKTADHGLRLYSVLSQSLPGFLLGMILQMVVAVWWGWAPVSGRVDEDLLRSSDASTSGFLITESIFSGDWAMAGSAIHHLILPLVTISWIVVGTNLRITRINMIEALNADYILAGTARGLSDRMLKYRYAFRNALLPIVTLLGLQLSLMLGGTVVIETVFSWPGLGKYMLDRILARDFPAIEGAIVIVTVFTILMSLLVDALYTLIDPRVEL